MSTSKSNSSIFGALEKIPKLQDNEGYLKWKRTISDHPKPFELWLYISTSTVLPVDEAEHDKWTTGQTRTCTALRLVLEGNAIMTLRILQMRPPHGSF